MPSIQSSTSMTMQPYCSMTRGREVSLKKPWVCLRAMEPITKANQHHVFRSKERRGDKWKSEEKKAIHTILSTARIDLKRLLISPNIELNPAPCTPQCCHRALLCPIIRLLPIRQIARIIAGTILSTIAQQVRIRKVSTELLWRREEIVD